MNGETRFEDHQAEARRCKWSCSSDTSLCHEQPCLPEPFRTWCKAPLRYGDAVQHHEQRRSFGFMALHARESWLDIRRCLEQGKSRTAGARACSADGAGAIAKQGKLVWLNMAFPRQSQGPGNIPPSMAQGSLCSLEVELREEETSSTEEKNCIVLSVYRINRPLYISVHRTKDKVYISVHRTYRGHFLGFPISVHRTPSSITTQYKNLEGGNKSQSIKSGSRMKT